MPQADSLFLPLLEFFSNKSGVSNKPDISSVESFSLTVFSIGLSSRKPKAESRTLIYYCLRWSFSPTNQA
ncbi:hypothetical protein [Flectobacillus sp. BAB-3569]|uniref:hypothetical protein n=1 Tax=Flectobacillus sp. BAB-3569 TaxID=1509483 RepID=UPI00114033AF|nr:hypothetical protein [Flectobacillus sp. BAB-3569]